MCQPGLCIRLYSKRHIFIWFWPQPFEISGAIISLTVQRRALNPKRDEQLQSWDLNPEVWFPNPCSVITLHPTTASNPPNSYDDLYFTNEENEGQPNLLGEGPQPRGGEYGLCLCSFRSQFYSLSTMLWLCQLLSQQFYISCMISHARVFWKHP